MIRSVVVLGLVPLLLIACDHFMDGSWDDESAVRLENFVPLTAANGCEAHPNATQWYTKGFIDVFITDQYTLPFKTVDTGKDGDWRPLMMTLSYELPPLPGLDAAAWEERTVYSIPVAESAGGVTVGTVQILTDEMHENLVQIFDAFAAMAVKFDWETYPMIITVRAAGTRPGSDRISHTNELRFDLVPSYGDHIRDGALYLDKGWPSDEEIAADFPLPQDQEQAKYERDKDIYDTMMLNCDFSQTHLAGCLPGQDYGLIDCYTFTEAADQIEGLYPEYDCCPKEEPAEPQAPTR